MSLSSTAPMPRNDMRHQHVIDAGTLRWLTAEVIARRFEFENQRRAKVALEHKALKSNWTAFRKNLDALNGALAKGNDMMPGVTNNVGGILGQVQGIVEDVEFMGKMLGNGSGEGSGEQEKPREQPAEKVVVSQADVGNIPPEVGQPQGATFPEGTVHAQ